jgi:hypothetical protein
MKNVGKQTGRRAAFMVANRVQNRTEYSAVLGAKKSIQMGEDFAWFAINL